MKSPPISRILKSSLSSSSSFINQILLLFNHLWLYSIIIMAIKIIIKNFFTKLLFEWIIGLYYSINNNNNEDKIISTLNYNNDGQNLNYNNNHYNNHYKNRTKKLFTAINNNNDNNNKFVSKINLKTFNYNHIIIIIIILILLSLIMIIPITIANKVTEHGDILLGGLFPIHQKV
ncbi:hypothetical protein DERP_008997 [Dermatophagoides pteronyssinus]|uniref:Uncharacterized protein n=1 Tax=Dermatophagoides pteronyssinus TaxID=6956 RepID=A0ABQ8JG47_DERPT|nr:hypothetical protein DERP_008997 [Dermatophagoides pteronyssinus]